MYIERVPNRKSPPAVLLRESFRQDGKVKKRTLANLSKWPDHLVEGFRILLKGGVALPSLSEAFTILRSRPHGHVAAVLGTARRLGLEKLLDRRRSRERSLAAAMILARILDPRSKLATARCLRTETLTHTLGEELGIEDAGEDELYRAMDWLLRRQDRIERHLAAEHLEDGSLVLCDITSVYFEGSKCPLAKTGYSRDGKRGTRQIVFALLCNREGCPLAVEVFQGNTADPATLASQLTTLRDRFSLSRVVVIGDRGLLTDARIREELQPTDFGWITALRAPAIRKLVESGDLQLELFDERDLGEITAPKLYPGDRLVVCRNPLLAAERRRKRLALMARTEEELDKVVAAHPARAAATEGEGEDRRTRRPGTASLQGRQALRDHHHRRQPHLEAQRGEDRPGGRSRRDLHPAHQCRRRQTLGRRDGPLLQEPEPDRAGFPQPQNRRSQGAPRPPPPRRPGPGPHLSLYARLLCGMAHASASRSSAVRR